MPDSTRKPITLPPPKETMDTHDRDMETFIRLLGRLMAERWRKISTTQPEPLPPLLESLTGE